MQTNINQSPCVLLVAANPVDEAKLQLEKELVFIMKALDNSKFNVKSELSTKPKDIRQALLKYKPTFVHFSGHGSEDGCIIFENNRGESNKVDSSALENLFKMFATHINCVVLNACYSMTQAIAIVKHINYVIGMNGEIGDDAAINFSSAFYDAVNANESLEFAYTYASNAIHLENSDIADHKMPVLYKRVILSDGKVDFETVSYGSEGFINSGSNLDSYGQSTQTVRQSEDVTAVRKDGKAIIKRLKVSDARQTCCEWGCDIILSSGFDRRLHSYNFSKNLTTTYPFTSKETVRSLCVFGKSILISNDAGRVYSIEDDNHEEILNAQQPVFCISKTENDNTILLAQGDGRITRWLILKESGSIIDAKLQNEVHSHDGKAFYVNYDPIENRYISVGEDGKLRYTKLATYETKAIPIFEHTIFSLAVASNTSLIAIGDCKGNIRFSKDYFNTQEKLNGHTDAVRSLSLSSVGQWLASGSKDNTVKLWNLNVQNSLLVCDCKDYIYEVKFSDLGDKLLIVDGGGHITCIDFIKSIDTYSFPELEMFIETVIF